LYKILMGNKKTNFKIEKNYGNTYRKH
jgi:hypothetical protein